MRCPLLCSFAIFLNALELEDVTAQSGITFRHQKSATSRKYLIESVTGGVAMFDYDGDGLLDLYFVNGAALKDPMKAGEQPDNSAPAFWNRLYRNRGKFTFEDVTEKTGVLGTGYGMGAAAGDFDNDGRVDLYVTQLGRNILYRNRGEGAFEDVTERARVGGGGWSSSAGWIDLDNDGWLELVVARYLKWDFEPDIWCGSRREGHRSYCHPDQFQPITQLVYRNKRDGTFERIEWNEGKGLGVAFEDYDRDGRMDVAIANDAYPQQLFRNLGGWKFLEVGLEANIAYDDDGRVFSGMGLDFADYDNDGWPDLFINALSMQRYALFRNTRKGFDYVSPATGVAKITQMRSGWGTKFVDLDNDGWRDIFVAQGHVMDNIELTQPSLRYLEPPLVMRNTRGKFLDVSAQSGVVKAMAARGAAFGDLDNDGWIDLAINVNNGPAVILRNKPVERRHWLIVEAPAGSRVRVVTESGEQSGLVSMAGSYLSSNDSRVHFGLGNTALCRLVEVTFPGGLTKKLQDVKADRVLKVGR